MARVNRPLADYLEQLLGEGPAAGKVAGDLEAMARLLAAEPRLRRALADPSIPAERKRALLGDIGRGQLDQATVALLAGLAERLRVPPGELVGVVVELAGRARLADAEVAGELEAVEGELLDLAALLERESRLRAALADPAIPTERKWALLEDLLGQRVRGRTLALVRLLVELYHGRRLERWARELATLAAARRNLVIAEVVTAVPLDGERQARLARALAAATGTPVRLRCTVDPSILGSVVVRVGDEVLDGSVRTALEQAREQLGVA